MTEADGNSFMVLHVLPLQRGDIPREEQHLRTAMDMLDLRLLAFFLKSDHTGDRGRYEESDYVRAEDGTYQLYVRMPAGVTESIASSLVCSAMLEVVRTEPVDEQTWWSLKAPTL